MSPERISRKRDDRSFLLHKSNLVGQDTSPNNLSSHHGNAATHFMRSSLLRVVSTLVMLLETKKWFPQAQDYLCYFAVL